MQYVTAGYVETTQKNPRDKTIAISEKLDVERKQMYSNSKSVQCAETPVFPDLHITTFKYQYDFKEQNYKQLPSTQKPPGTAFL